MSKIADPQKVFHYVYLCQDTSVLTPYMKRFIWNWVLALVPRYTSANLLSFIANFGSLVGFLALIGLFGPAHVIARTNSLIYLVPAFGIFFYHTLDNIDGSQARRTHSSSPLGEFMDHWFDTFNSFMLPVGIVYSFQVDHVYVVILAVTSVWAFWATMWEQRKTGTIILGRVSQVEGVVLVILIHFAAAIFGADLFHTRVFGLEIIEYLAILTASSYCLITLQAMLRFNKDRLEMYGVTASMGIVIIWYALALARGINVEGHILVAVVIGLIGCKHIGDLQRSRLIGAAYHPADFSFLAGGALLIISLFLPLGGLLGMSELEWQVLLCGSLTIWVGARLFYQYFHTTGYITEKLGINVFTLTAEQKRKVAESVEAA